MLDNPEMRVRGVETDGEDSDSSGEFSEFVFILVLKKLVTLIFAVSWRKYLRGVGGRAQSVHSFDDSTSSDDGDSERGEGEGDISDLDQELHGVVEPGRQEDGHEILGKLFCFVYILD